MKLIRQNISTLMQLCNKHCVIESYLFGSILTTSFSRNSNIDFLVKFGQVNPPGYFDNYSELKESLEKPYQRMVDLVEVQILKKPILKRSIDRTKKLIYGRENTEVLV